MRPVLSVALGTWLALALAPRVALAQASSPASPARGGHASVIVGSGSSSEGGSMGARALQLAFGQDITDRVRCDASYINEGHPRNNHRDGFSVACWRTQPVTPAVRLEAGAGPYFSMNTTTPAGGTQINDKRLGLVMSAAVIYRIRGADMHLRAQYNHVVMPGAPSSDAIMVGLGTDFDGTRPVLTAADGTTEVGIWAGAAQVTEGSSKPGVGSQFEARRHVSHAIAYSVSAISEAQDDGALHRAGVAFQAWWGRPTGEKWKLSIGAGPVLARDRNLAGDRDKVLGLLSVEAAHEIAPRITASIRFNRIVSSYDKDADQFMVGISRSF